MSVPALSSIVFARTRHQYDSYRDFWDLVSLAGFDTCHVDEMDLRTDTFYVVTPINGEFRPHMDYCRNNVGGKRRAVVAWWNLERPDGPGSEPIGAVLDEIMRYVDIAWVSDRHYASLDSRLQHVVLGSNARLCPQRERDLEEATYDFTHQSYVFGRRDAAITPLRLSGLREGPNGWFEARDAVLRSSRVIVNVHQTEAPIGEPIRFAMAAAYKIPMISETLMDPFPLISSADYLDVPISGIGDAVRASTLMNPDELRRLGENLHARLCNEWTFSRGVHNGVVDTLARIGGSR